jgi:lysophospholipase L1-like esterase
MAVCFMVMRMAHSKFRSTAVRMLLSACVTVAIFAMVEGTLALFSTGGWSQLYTGDPGYFWTLRPGVELAEVPHLERETSFSVQTNAQGLRDGPLPVDGPWILALGCSTTFGWGVEAEQAWPELLEDRLGVPVVNAGVPGHSSHQGRTVATELLRHRPTVVILGWGLRDGQGAPVMDKERRPAAWMAQTHLYRWLVGVLPGKGGADGSPPRVSVADYRDNLALISFQAQRQDARVLILDMTRRADWPNHGRLLSELGLPLVVPQLTDADHFPEDPIHMNASGNETLAAQLEGPLRALLGGQTTAESQPLPPPVQTP